MDGYIKSLYLCVKDMDRAIKFYESKLIWNSFRR